MTPIVTLEGLDGYDEIEGNMSDYYSGNYDGTDEAILSGIEELLGSFISTTPSIAGVGIIENIYDFDGVFLSDNDLAHLDACADNVELQGFDGTGFGDANLGWKAFKKLRKKVASVAKAPIKVIKSHPIAKIAKRGISAAVKRGIAYAKKAGISNLTKLIPAPYNLIAQGLQQYAGKIPGLQAKLNQLKSKLGPILQKAGVDPNIINSYINTAIQTQVGKGQVSTAKSLMNVKKLQQQKAQQLTKNLAAKQKKEVAQSLATQKGWIDLVAQFNNMIYQASIGKKVQALKVPTSIVNSASLKKILPTLKRTIDTARKRNVASTALVQDQSQNYKDVLNMLHGDN